MMKLRYIVLSAVFFVSVGSAMGQIPSMSAPRGYVIGPGDVLSIKALGEKDFDVLLMPKNPTNRRRDVTRGQRGRRHLVQQRLKHVMVVAIEQRNAHAGARERARGVQSAESTADDDDVRVHGLSAMVLAWRPNQSQFSAGRRQSSRRRVRSIVPTRAASRLPFSTAK